MFPGWRLRGRRYAAWYKAVEKPKLTDAQFHDQEDFTINLTGFRQRFGAPK
ncbi:hypothetical protein [Sphingomonas sp.]|uniref:hypothetical protein n=1 Tax=Sphingomonas sp. TaxID=28214 RepID=UPI0035C8059D